MDSLSLTSLHQLPDDVVKPSYDIESTGAGIVHIGPGAFHRGHQAVFTDLAMKFGGNWRITAVSLRSRDLKQKLTPQDNLYSLMVLDNEPYVQVVGALKSVLVLDEDRQQIMQALTSPDTHIVTLTVTEKGYCVNESGTLDRENPDIKQDLASPEKPVSVIGLLVKALNDRRQKQAKPITVISCDNLPDNGGKLKSAVVQFAAIISHELAKWIDTHIQFPNTMVDSITPATDQQAIDYCQQKLGLNDAWPVQREKFAQWVIEDKFSGPRPAWERVGVTITDNVELYEKAKLRVLNGTHSTLAYLGCLLNIETVYEAISQPAIESFIRRLLKQEIIPSIGQTEELDLEHYAELIIRRYQNKHIRHLLSQIACDGSQKIPIRILNPIRDNLKNDGSVSLLCVPVAAWLLFLWKRFSEGEKVIDPRSEELKKLASSVMSADEFARTLLANTDVFGDLAEQTRFVDSLLAQLKNLKDLGSEGAATCLADL